MNVTTKSFTMRHAANELQSIRNEMAGSEYDTGELIQRVDAVGHWLSFRNIGMNGILKLLSEAHDIRQRLG